MIIKIQVIQFKLRRQDKTIIVFPLGGIYLVAMVYGIVKEYNDDEPELPVIGDFAKNIFQKQIEKE